MTCVAGPPTFRLLDGFVGWSPDGTEQNLVGLTDPGGIRLAPILPGALDPDDLLPHLPPAVLADGCDCRWFLVSPAPPQSRLLRLDSCSDGWQPVHDGCCAENVLERAVAVAVWRHYVAVADAGRNRVFVWSHHGAHLAAEIPVSAPGPLAFSARGKLLVARSGSTVIAQFRLDGSPCGPLAGAVPEGDVERMRTTPDGRVWLVTRAAGTYRLWVSAVAAFVPATLDELRTTFDGGSIVAASARGFCMQLAGDNAVPYRCCYSWFGRCLDGSAIEPHARPRVATDGQLITTAVDSGRPRCRWHRVRIDADVPTGTSIDVAVATSEEDQPPGGIVPADWESGLPGSDDFLIGRPPGRYLFMRLRLTGDGTSTPVVRRLRIDFPRITSLDALPVVYRENPDAEDFSERFLGLFDATIEDLDRSIERFPALLDAERVPPAVLPWLGSFLDLAFERGWSVAQRRRLLRALPEIYRRRGTVEGLRLAILEVFGAEPAIQEAAAGRSWGSVGSAQVGGVRLFGRSRARFRLGTSALCSAPLRSYGNPDQDPPAVEAYRFRVLVPPAGEYGPIDLAKLKRLVDAQKPAHTVATSVRTGAGGLVLGSDVAVGIDTVLSHLPAPVLGRGGSVRLRRASIVWPGRAGPSRLAIGRPLTVGVNTVLE
jgi:phage tail-like protein